MANSSHWKLGNIEIGKHCGGSSEDQMKVYIGKMMPLVSFGSPIQVPAGINKGCMANDKKCKPNMSSQVTTQNYRTVPTNKRIDGTKVKFAEKLRIEIRDNNVDELAVTLIEGR